MGLVPDGVLRNLGKLIGRLYFIEGSRQSELGKVGAADNPRQVQRHGDGLVLGYREGADLQEGAEFWVYRGEDGDAEGKAPGAQTLQ
jgi:hypothetical protein